MKNSDHEIDRLKAKIAALEAARAEKGSPPDRKPIGRWLYLTAGIVAGMVVAVGGVVVYIIHAQQPARAVSDSATDTSSAADAAASTPAAPAAADAAATTATNAPDAVDESHIFLTCSETNASNGNTDTFELEITPAAWFMNGQKQNSWVNGHLESGQVSMSTTAIEISEIVPGIVIKYTIDRQNGDIIRTMISTSQDQPSNSAPAWHGHCDKHGPPKTSF